MLKRTIMTLLILAFSGIGVAKVIETRTIEDVVPLIDEETWFLVDLDNTLFETAQAFGHTNWFYDEIEQRMNQGVSRDEAITEIYPLWLKIQERSNVQLLRGELRLYFANVAKSWCCRDGLYS